MINKNNSKIITLFNVESRYIAMIVEIISAAGKVAIVCIMLIALIYGSFGNSTVIEILQRIHMLWTGYVINRLNITPSQIMTIIIYFFISAMCFNLINRWLKDKHFTKCSAQ